MNTLITLLTSWFMYSGDAAALQTTAPQDLTVEQAAEHMAAAQVAGVKYNVDPDLVLAIAWHESRYDNTARTAEPGGKTSCGTMTPIPKVTCSNPTLLDGYLEGTAHLREWLNACRGNERCALLGYAGGYVLLRACAQGPVMKERRDGHNDDICLTPQVFQFRARWIKKSRARRATS